MVYKENIKLIKMKKIFSRFNRMEDWIPIKFR